MSTEEKPQTRSLVRKLAEVTALVDRVAKNGRNQAQNYDYVTEADILAAVRLHMAERLLVPFPHVREQKWETAVTKSGATKKTVTLTVEFRIEDGESGEVRTWDVVSQGEDTGDKAAYKAITGAEKYGLLKVFMISTGDDPEKDSDTRVNPNKPAAPLPTPDEVIRDLHAAPASGAQAGQPGPQMTVWLGKHKGKLLSELDDGYLEWLTTATEPSINDPKWGKVNRERLAALKAEAARRKGSVKAPAATSPRTAPLPFTTEDEGEEIVTPTMAFLALAREAKMTPARLANFASKAIGKETGWTHADVEALRGALNAVAGAFK